MQHVVSQDEDNLRIDRLIQNSFQNIGYVFLQKLFRLKKIKINEKKAVASDRVRTGDIVKIFADLKKEVDSFVSDSEMSEKLKSMIIFENKDFFAINKPAKLAVQSGTKVSTCVDTYIKAYHDCKCHLVHRLDKDTSGILLIAKGTASARQLTELFRENKIKKTYLAVVKGKIHHAGKIDNFLEKTFVGNEEKMRVCDSGQRAITFYKPLKTIDDKTLLELRPSTGRKHQLRVHCADVLNAPILGDNKYRAREEGKSAEYLFLHAYKLVIEDLQIEITAELPEYWKDFRHI